jgi:glycosyltransferase involved in cell wall biosynthesis
LLCGRTTDVESRQVLFLGRLGTWKGADLLLEAVYVLQGEGVAARYVLAGDGDVEGSRTIVRSLPDPAAVTVTGWVGADEVHRLLHESSIFCLPSRVEALPMALLQAMGHGLAVVATPVGSIPEVIEDGVNGALVAVGNAAALADSLRALLADVEARRELGRRAAATIEAGYAPDVVMRRLWAIYSRLATRGSCS